MVTNSILPVRLRGGCERERDRDHSSASHPGAEEAICVTVLDLTGAIPAGAGGAFSFCFRQDGTAIITIRRFPTAAEVVVGESATRK